MARNLFVSRNNFDCWWAEFSTQEALDRRFQLPLRTGGAPLGGYWYYSYCFALVCASSVRGVLFCLACCFLPHGLDFREMSYVYNVRTSSVTIMTIIIIITVIIIIVMIIQLTVPTTVAVSYPNHALERERGQSWKWSTTRSCIICFGEYAYGDDLCRLPCRHMYHAQVRLY